MSAMERIYRIDQLLAGRKAVPRAELQDKLGVSWATLKRDLAYMKDRLHAPIVFDRDLGGYRFEKEGQRIGPQYELPGLWFSAEEIHALLTMQHLLANLDTGGLLGPHIQPLLARLSGLLGSADNPAEEVKKRIHIETVGARRFHLSHFQAVGSALLRRKRMLIRYHARGTDQETAREISPQRLIYYRDNWYLDAWCHLREDLRAFSLDAIRAADILEKKAKEVSEKRLDQVLGSGYGIFSGDNVTWATLHFTPERARWVAAEKWHPDQVGRVLEDGGYELKVPYTDDRELLMDVLKFGDDCVVVAPDSLRRCVLMKLSVSLSNYESAKLKP
ncbi:Helix-turn-helix type 11 domain protein [Methyloversatilis universalis FAM5]|uniref:Helix-turn-helix type 11 domain protein n=1 Tax=Methyloversatilis universalis (strain ATCC BAA-1314 / DSM 25237 / JCM 13912 / CCUG 52030 / FAM5) TaxID=1000565 RepID=F5RBC4_METUF|nr:YafY family protein [Methyloversatilis universalis]EGK72095.1 Helix-turn-helix type 11 domain protein [Methyloversatilis universalis FAM5]